MKKGFTLIELLAVIVVLAVLALIVVPIAGNVINNSKDQANMMQINSILEAARIYRDKNMFNDIDTDTNLFSNLIEYLDLTKAENFEKEISKYYKTADRPIVKINKSGDIALAIVLNNKCYLKKYNDENVSISYNDGKCVFETPISCFKFNLVDNHYEIAGYNCGSYYDGYTDIEIPSKYNGKPVTIIKENAFNDSRIIF